VQKIHCRISQQARFGGKRMFRSWIHDVDQLKSGNISTRCSSMKRSSSGDHVFKLAFEHTEDILNTDFSYV